MTDTPRIRFSFDLKALKSQANVDGNFFVCPHRGCRKRRRCTGGPRGTFRKYGRPLCRLPHIARQIGLKLRAKFDPRRES